MIIENIATVRQIQQCLDDGELSADLLSLLKGFEARIASIFPKVPWRKIKLNRTGVELLLVPDQAWEILDREAVAISLYMKGVLEPGFYDGQDDPFVGIYVPGNWEHSETFARRLEEEAPKGWSCRNGNTDYDEQYPIWHYVAVSKYAAGNSFDVEGFYAEVASAIGVLLDLRPQIDDLLEQVKIPK